MPFYQHGNKYGLFDPSLIGAIINDLFEDFNPGVFLTTGDVMLLPGEP